MSNLKVYFFGKFSVQHADVAISGLEAQKVQELLSYLLCYRDRPHLRENLAALLWGDVPTEKSKKYLRQCLWHLQAALSGGSQQIASPLLLVDDAWVQVNPEADYWLDLQEFESRYARLHALPASGLLESDAESLYTAVNLYQDGLLQGWYQEWCVFERDRLQLMCLSLLSKLMAYAELNRRYDAGLDYGKRALHLDTACERTHCQIMRLMYLSGDRTGVLRQYERCTAALQQELGVGPSHSTLELYNQIRLDQLDQSAFDLPSPLMPNGSSPASLPEVLERLQQFHRTLEYVRDQLQAQIRQVESLMKDQ